MYWKVERNCPYGLIGEDTFTTFEKATRGFRKILQIKLGEQISHYTDQIDGYCEKFYPDGAPAAFQALKDLLTKLATDPTYPENPDALAFDDFEDERVEFYMDSYSKSLRVYVDDESVKPFFPQAVIDIIKMDDPENEYRFFITDNDCHMMNLELAPTELLMEDVNPALDQRIDF